MLKILVWIEKSILYLTIAILPVFVVLNSVSPAIVSKLQLLVAALSFSITVWVIKMVIRGKINWNTGKFDLPVLLIAITYLLSALIKTPNKLEAFAIPGLTTFVIVSAILYFLVNQLDQKGKEGIVASIIISGIFLSLSLIFSSLSIFSKIPQLPNIIKDPLFNPLGGILPAGIFLVPIVILAIAEIVKEKDVVKKIFWAVAVSIITMSIVILVGNALPGHPQYPKLPSFATSWEVATGALRTSPILGVGTGNYLSAFNQFRSVSYNQSELWQLRFSTARNFYLTLFTETGLLGLAIFSLLLFTIYKSFKDEFKFGKTSVIALLLIIGVLPASPIMFVQLFVLLAIFSSSEGKEIVLSASRGLGVLIGLLILTGVVATGYFATKIMSAEVTFTKSIAAFNKNDAKTTYNLMQEAVNKNSKVDRYHASFAQVNMAIAQSLSTKKDLTDEDKKTITQLVQQSINQGKLSVSLNSGRSGNWELLAQIYKSIMPFAKGADNFAIQTYTQAISLDPTNPTLRISLGGVYYSLGRYDEAVDTFKLAVVAKQDLANAHYNLSAAYREKQDFENAIREMNVVLTLVKIDSKDYSLAKSELDNLEKNKPTKNINSSENLTPPLGIPKSKISPPLSLPEDLNPPSTK